MEKREDRGTGRERERGRVFRGFLHLCSFVALLLVAVASVVVVMLSSSSRSRGILAFTIYPHIFQLYSSSNLTRRLLD